MNPTERVTMIPLLVTECILSVMTWIVCMTENQTYAAAIAYTLSAAAAIAVLFGVIRLFSISNYLLRIVEMMDMTMNKKEGDNKGQSA